MAKKLGKAADEGAREVRDAQRRAFLAVSRLRPSVCVCECMYELHMRGYKYMRV